MRVHILAIGGVFMGNLAFLLQQLGWQVSGSDTALYPPMKDLLAEACIPVQDYDPALARSTVDCFVVGNSISRGNPLLEAVLDKGLAYTSGPAILSRYILFGRKVIAVAGTHGKTTTSSMLVHIFEGLGLDVGYLIGGSLKRGDSQRGSHQGSHPVFVIEADEYDSAFCDKRAKFVHYRPYWVVLNNLEYDHADIYPNLDAIETQFHHLVRLVPHSGTVIYPASDKALGKVIKRGIWSRQIKLGEDWKIVRSVNRWGISYLGETEWLNWKLLGEHNALNACSAVAAASVSGVDWHKAVAMLADFGNAERRMQLLGIINRVHFYTDFAHHPTAIRATLDSIDELPNINRLLVILHPASNTMRSHIHAKALLPALNKANLLWLYQPNQNAFSHAEALAAHPGWQGEFSRAEILADAINLVSAPNDCVLTLSNGDIEGVHKALLGE